MHLIAAICCPQYARSYKRWREFDLIVIGKSIICCCSIFAVNSGLKAISETTSDAVEIVKVIASPGPALRITIDNDTECMKLGMGGP
jgi:hypothetical protein